jgi:hypothetical protein
MSIDELEVLALGCLETHGPLLETLPDDLPAQVRVLTQGVLGWSELLCPGLEPPPEPGLGSEIQLSPVLRHGNETAHIEQVT